MNTKHRNIVFHAFSKLFSFREMKKNEAIFSKRLEQIDKKITGRNGMEQVYFIQIERKVFSEMPKKDEALKMKNCAG